MIVYVQNVLIVPVLIMVRLFVILKKNKYFGVENPSCFVGVCTDFEEKKGD